MEKSYHTNKTICLDFGSEAAYQECLENPAKFKQRLEEYYQSCPELFPLGMKDGWILYGYKHSKKRNLQ